MDSIGDVAPRAKIEKKCDKSLTVYELFSDKDSQWERCAGEFKQPCPAGVAKRTRGLEPQKQGRRKNSSEAGIEPATSSMKVAHFTAYAAEALRYLRI